jgi:hypothetical protein
MKHKLDSIHSAIIKHPASSAFIILLFSPVLFPLILIIALAHYARLAILDIFETILDR